MNNEHRYNKGMIITESITKAQQAADLLTQDLRELVSVACDAPGITGVVTWQYSLELLKEAQELNAKLLRLL